MARATYYRRDDTDDFPPFGGCPECNDKDPSVRANHQLRLARDGGIDLVRSHLTDAWVKQREPHKQRPDLVDDVCRWIGTLMEQYGNMPSPVRGTNMPWWEARKMIQSMSQEPQSPTRNPLPSRSHREPGEDELDEDTP